MAGNYSRIGIPGLTVSTTAGRLPAEETLTGLISHTDTTTLVTGDADVDFSKVHIGDFIFANSVLRKIIDIDVTQKRIQVESTFGATLTDVAFKVCRTGVYRHIGFKNSADGAEGEVDGAAFPAGESVNYNNDGGLTPILYDATGTSFLISTIQ